MTKLNLVAPLTNAQSLLWIGQALYPDAPLYNMAMRFDIDGPVDAERFRRAHAQLVEEFDALRCIIEDADAGESGALIAFRGRGQSAVEFDLVDLETRENDAAVETKSAMMPSAQSQASLRRHIDRSISRMFDVRQQTGRSVLYRLSDTHWTWLLCQHHLVTDVGSFSLLFKRLGQIYQQLDKAESASGESGPHFADFVQSQHQRRQRRDTQVQQQWWLQQAGRSAAPPQLLQTLQSSPRSRRFDLQIEDSDRTALVAMIASERFALTRAQSWFVLSAALLSVWLWRLDREYNVVRIGFPVHGRTDRKTRNTVGLLMESVFIDVEPSADKSFDQLLREVSASVTAALRQTGTGNSQKAALQSAHVYLNYLNVQFADFAGLQTKSHWLHTGFADPQHPLRLQVSDFDGAGISMALDCNVEAVPESVGKAMRTGFVQLLRSAAKQPRALIGQLALAPAQESSEITTTAPDLMARLHEVTQAYPQRVALESNGVCISYQQLQNTVHALAAKLREAGLTPSQPVLLVASRSIGQIVGILAILEANGAWVPVETTMPAARLQTIVKDIHKVSGREALILTQSDTVLDRLGPISDQQIIRFDPLQQAAVDPQTTTTPPTSAARQAGELARQRAYVMYTSGSTGEPKGVAVSRGALSNYLQFAEREYLRSRSMDFAHVSPPAFDLGITTSLLPLITGNRLIIYGDASDNGASLDSAFIDAIRDRRAGFMKLTPSQLAVVDDDDWRKAAVRCLIVGGEDFAASLAHRLTELIGEVAIYNEYGPTEATVGCTSHLFDPLRDTGASVPIGKAMDHTRVTVVDRCLAATPAGLVGEVLIGGASIADGYLNRTEATAARFIKTDKGVCYRSGDLARLDEFGVLHYLGRADRQLKLRGVRIEPAEIENELRRIEGVADAVVLAVSPREITSRRYPRNNTDVGGQKEATVDDRHRCVRCGIESTHPNAEIRADAGGVCSLCLSFDEMHPRVSDYFGTEADFRTIAARMRAGRSDQGVDCIALLSGGKDSSYMLYRLVDFGVTPLALTLDNGFISEQAKSNIDRIVSDLGVEHVYVQTPHMNAIFADSLRRFSNVCQGCFKTIYTLATEHAMRLGVRHVVTGLSRGQLFETRLHELYRRDDLSTVDYDQRIEQARRVYHRMDDVVYRTIGCDIFENDEAFERVEFIDFYRYVDVGLQTVMTFLDEQAPWIRPSDTGRSTNCLINDAGIYVHRQQRGFHNYALPYSWDVRLGHKTRDAALAELDDDIDPAVVEPILRDIGFRSLDTIAADDRQLVAFYKPASANDGELDVKTMRSQLLGKLPSALVPVRYVGVTAIPQTSNGKVDASALIQYAQADTEEDCSNVVVPDEHEKLFIGLYRDVLGHDQIRIDQSFFAMGGDSLSAIRISERARQHGYNVSAVAILEADSIRSVAAVSLSSKQVTPAVGVEASADPAVEDSDAIDDLVGVDDLDAIAAQFRTDA